MRKSIWQMTRYLAKRRLLNRLKGFLAVSLGVICLSSVAGAEEAKTGKGPLRIALPQIDAARGRDLFTHKACVVCHSINGVGGTGAPSLDAAADNSAVDILDFFARMWRGADAMMLFQSRVLGYSITLSGQDIGDLAAFAGTRTAQTDFSLEDVPVHFRDWFVNDLSEWAPELYPAEDE